MRLSPLDPRQGFAPRANANLRYTLPDRKCFSPPPPHFEKNVPRGLHVTRKSGGDADFFCVCPHIKENKNKPKLRSRQQSLQWHGFVSYLYHHTGKTSKTS